MDEPKRDPAAYRTINVDPYVRIAHLIKALRKIQGADNLTDCHRIAERILNGGKSEFLVSLDDHDLKRTGGGSLAG